MLRRCMFLVLLIGIGLVIVRHLHDGDAGTASRPYVVLMAAEGVGVAPWDDLAAAVVWSPTASELIVPDALAPAPREAVLWLAPDASGTVTGRWLQPGKQSLWAERAIYVSDVGPDGRVRLQTPDGPVSIGSGEVWSYVDADKNKLALEHAGSFQRLQTMP